MFKPVAIHFGLTSWASYSRLTASMEPADFRVTELPNLKIRPAVIPMLQQKVKLISHAPLAVNTAIESPQIFKKFSVVMTAEVTSK